MKISKIFKDAKDKNVATFILYGDGSSTLYTDSAKSVKVDYETALDLCFKGVVVFVTDTYYPVTSFKDDSGTSVTIKVNDVDYTVSK